MPGLDQGDVRRIPEISSSSAAEGLIPHVQFVKVDIRRTRPPARAATARRLGTGVQLVAEKVESHEEFDATRDEGYVLFQGNFFLQAENHYAPGPAGQPPGSTCSCSRS